VSNAARPSAKQKQRPASRIKIFRKRLQGLQLI